MNIKSIKNAVKTTYSKEDEGFVARSMLLPDVIGVGETEEEALQIFEELLQDHYDDWKADRLAENPTVGRPSKGKVKFAVELSPDIKDSIAGLAKKLRCSQGEAVEYLYNCHQHLPG